MEYYKEQVLEDLRNYADEADYKGKSVDEVRDLALMDDSITGNASGSYFCNTWKAQEALTESGVLFDDEFLSRLEEYGVENPLAKGAEWLDVMARCIALDYINDDELMEAVGIEEEDEEDE